MRAQRHRVDSPRQESVLHATAGGRGRLGVPLGPTFELSGNLDVAANLTRPSQPASYKTATLSTCLVTAREATRRDLGKAGFGVQAVVADDRDLYWLSPDLEGADDASGAHIPEQQIRRAARLPAR
jgi:hypothetical protein